jgi:hypothetical protein
MPAGGTKQEKKKMRHGARAKVRVACDYNYAREDEAVHLRLDVLALDACRRGERQI